MSKCNACNAVINELLAFVQNKIEVMDDESMVMICSRSFSAPEISAAKTLLYEVVPTEQRLRTRRNEGRSQRDMEDIIGLMKSTEPKEIPVFVARDLSRLPPITWDHIDVTRLLKDIVALKKDIATLRHCSATKEELEAVQQEVAKHTQPRLPSILQTTISGTRFTDDSGPMGLDGVMSAQKDIPVTHPPIVKSHTFSPTPSTNSKKLINGIPEKERTKSTLIISDSVSKESDFKLVTYKKRRRTNRNIIGTSTNNSSSKIKAAPRTAYIYVANLDSSVTTQDLSDHMKDIGETVFDVHKLPQSSKVTYSEYKISMHWDRLPVVLNKDLWPPGVIVGRYHQNSARNGTSNNKSQ